ncbi:unnamed protein product [Haemonchus placei]|uniref:Galactose mutarotase n=1 Tax=Haemonchus placei TaxID=6290 RepID=A0A0N4WTK9_HAEPC|nr:unnamed protein product [Haemonchus placei]
MNSLIEISSTQGVTAQFIPLGATLTSLFVKDRDGNDVDVVLGYDNIKADNAYMGRTVGRVCNRIRFGQFTFDGREYQLPINDHPHLIHGGPQGIKEWEVVRQTPTSVTFRIWADEANDGFPGDAKIDITYTVNDRNQLLIEHGATCTAPGVLNLTNHSYWNLDGSVRFHLFLAHVLGEVLDVKGCRFDFTEEKSLESLVDDRSNIDIDHDLVLSADRSPGHALTLYSPTSGIKMGASTSYPVIHLYGSRHLHSVEGKGGEHYQSGKALAIEPQFHTAFQDNFPSIRFDPEQPYFQEVVYTFSTISHKK